MNSPLFISVVMATCYREHDLLECVESVLAQNYPDCEILVIDQDPERRSEALLKTRFAGESRLRYYCLERAGAARSRNFGVAEARGEVVAFIDDDAIAEPGWLAGIAEAFSCRPEPALMAGRIRPLWMGTRPSWYPQEREFLLGLYDIGDEMCPMPANDQPIGANMAGLRSVILENGGFDEKLGPSYFRKRPMITGEEAILGQRIRRGRHPIIYQPRACVRHRISPRKLTRSYFLQRHFWEGVTTIEQMAALGQIEAKRSVHYSYHWKAFTMALARFFLPTYGNRYTLPKPVIRMLALSRVSFHLGVVYGVLSLSPGPAKTECASA